MSTPNPVSQTQNAVFAISYAAVAGFPAGSVVDHVNVTITGSATGNTTPQSQNVPPATASVTFTNLTPDTYTYSVQGMPASGAGYGTAVTGTFTITSVATISLNLPSAVAVTQP
jgi:hypothetical protein